jgi:lysine 2,3-aminomutase
VDAPGGGGKRDVHSYEYYNRESGISVYTAPSVKPGQYFMYFDPLHSLSESARDDWQNPHRREQMVQEAQFEAHARMGKR